ncbi:hypothetical protein B566_EDAN007406 [Ephemera danica]|nr:hypothetical protein B566_EDAN007406 [Ephemera danica]
MATLERWCIAVAACLLMIVTWHGAEGCNEAVCASVVSKCMLTQSCKCELKNCSCCKECSHCLGHLYTECCSCVDLCPKPNETSNLLSKKSHVEDLIEPVEALYNILTAQPDEMQRWVSFTYPIDFDLTAFSPKLDKEIKYETHVTEQEVNKDKVTLNCTVAFQTQCMSWNKCRDTCISMGASSYRWFHDGCCECIGNTCINYGINESRYVW